MVIIAVSHLPRGCRAQREHGLSPPDLFSLLCAGPSNVDNLLASMSSATTQSDLRRLRAQRQQILGCAANHGARNVRVFGSTVRGESGASSDFDLLVEMEPGRTLLDLVGLWQDLEDLLGAHVDVLSDGGVSPHLRERIYAEAVPL
jgi:predicted nucleotidyltransferase